MHLTTSGCATGGGAGSAADERGGAGAGSASDDEGGAMMLGEEEAAEEVGEEDGQDASEDEWGAEDEDEEQCEEDRPDERGDGPASTRGPPPRVPMAEGPGEPAEPSGRASGGRSQVAAPPRPTSALQPPAPVPGGGPKRRASGAAVPVSPAKQPRLAPAASADDLGPPGGRRPVPLPHPSSSPAPPPRVAPAGPRSQAGAAALPEVGVAPLLHPAMLLLEVGDGEDEVGAGAAKVGEAEVARHVEGLLRRLAAAHWPRGRVAATSSQQRSTWGGFGWGRNPEAEAADAAELAAGSAVLRAAAGLAAAVEYGACSKADVAASLASATRACATDSAVLRPDAGDATSAADPPAVPWPPVLPEGGGADKAAWRPGERLGGPWCSPEAAAAHTPAALLWLAGEVDGCLGRLRRFTASGGAAEGGDDGLLPSSGGSAGEPEDGSVLALFRERCLRDALQVLCSPLAARNPVAAAALAAMAAAAGAAACRLEGRTAPLRVFFYDVLSRLLAFEGDAAAVAAAPPRQRAAAAARGEVRDAGNGLQLRVGRAALAAALWQWPEALALARSGAEAGGGGGGSGGGSGDDLLLAAVRAAFAAVTAGDVAPLADESRPAEGAGKPPPSPSRPGLRGGLLAEATGFLGLLSRSAATAGAGPPAEDAAAVGRAVAVRLRQQQPQQQPRPFASGVAAASSPLACQQLVQLGTDVLHALSLTVAVGHGAPTALLRMLQQQRAALAGPVQQLAASLRNTAVAAEAGRGGPGGAAVARPSQQYGGGDEAGRLGRQLEELARRLRALSA